jgi:hypothetical protein
VTVWTRICLGWLSVVGIVQAQEAVDANRLAYNVFVGCYSQMLWSIGRPGDSSELKLDLEGCRDLAIATLRRSRSPGAARYLAHLTLLGIDGHAAESVDEAIASKGATIKRYLREARKQAGKVPCTLPGTPIAQPHENLCADAFTATRRIDSYLGGN